MVDLPDSREVISKNADVLLRNLKAMVRTPHMLELIPGAIRRFNYSMLESACRSTLLWCVELFQPMPNSPHSLLG